MSTITYDPAAQLNIRFAHQPREGVITSGGMPIHYLDWGDPSAHPFLLLHGFTSHAHGWDFLADRLCKKYRIVAIDMPGHGDSGWSLKGYTIDIFRKELLDFCDGLGLKRFSLLGQSLGGMAAMDFASRYPERVERLLIVDAGPKVPQGGKRDLIVKFFGGKSRFASPEDVFAFRRSQDTRCVEYMERYLTYHAVKQLKDGSWTWKYDKLFRNPLLLLLKTRQPDLWGSLPHIKCPTLVLHGELSPVLTQDVADRMAQVIPHCKLVTLKDTSHRIHIERPEEFERLVQEFLAAGVSL